MATTELQRQNDDRPGGAGISPALLAGVTSKKEAELKRYLLHYGFSRDPFSDRGTVGLFFPGAGRKQTVDSLLHFLRYGSTPVFLTGVVGSGKTTVLQEMIRQLEPDVDGAFVNAELMMSSGQLMTAIATAFGVGRAGWRGTKAGSPAARVREFAKNTEANERQAVLCIDSAQDLTAEVIRSVFQLVASTNGALRLLWVGDIQAAAVVEEAASCVDLLINRIELPPLTQQDVINYIVYRLESCGYVGPMPLTELQLQALLYRSQGNINQLHAAARSMLMAAIDNTRPRWRPFPLTHLLLIAALLAGMLYLWRTMLAGEPIVEEGPLIVLEGVSTVPPAEQHANNSDVGGGATEVSTGDEASVKAAIASEIAALEASKPAEPEVARPVAEGPVAEKPVQAVATAEPAAPTIIVTSTEPTVSAGEVSSETVEMGPATVSSSRGAVSAELGSVLPAQSRLLAWPELGYALQVFGTHNVRRARQLVADYFGEADLMYYETRHNGKPWYVVVSGPYSGREAAQSSIRSLPESLQRLRPWPRNVASIQSDIRRFSAMVSNPPAVNDGG